MGSKPSSINGNVFDEVNRSIPGYAEYDSIEDANKISEVINRSLMVAHVPKNRDGTFGVYYDRGPLLRAVFSNSAERIEYKSRELLDHHVKLYSRNRLLPKSFRAEFEGGSWWLVTGL